jgi:hypothetical protein
LLNAVTFLNGQEADWTQLKVLQSTRADVEKILGQPYEKANNPFFGSYRAKGGNVFIQYSMGLCKPNYRGGWNVESQTVIDMAFFYYIEPTLKSLKLDKKKYKKVIEGDVLDIFTYKNDEDGIKYIVQKGKVETIVYYPTKKFDWLQCSIINNLKPIPNDF